MKRSKALFVSNILATLYSAYLLWALGSSYNRSWAERILYQQWGAYFKLAFDLLGISSAAMNYLYAITILLCLHIVTFVLGCLMGWIAYAGKKSGIAKFAATLYLIGTICFPIFLIFGLPITIVGSLAAASKSELTVPPLLFN